MIYGFIDESGAPGASTQPNNYVALAVVLFDSQKIVERTDLEIVNLRKQLHLAKDFEFHATRNTLQVQTSFLKFADSLGFRYIYVSLKKTALADFGSYRNLVSILLKKLEEEYQNETFSIRLDDNPTLDKEIHAQYKHFRLKMCSIKQLHSKNSSLIQLADYIVTMSSRAERGKVVPSTWKRISKRKSL